ncbi:tetratricopeptide repeat protein [Mesorhizobium sp. M1B.F.Ca.ET.045.04.1.1]|uniref:tetratricopeptide repeat protein n=1 Tax=Mesorhizobium sp. M1B.F.Ca.ET.045.04.1.1 TaxID=2493673 RepID=UPI000F764873|nr:tetratricopeptide repeat protein [Mesorhizobium sp. M1B.F.Ca.ET.045.04.1.1]AZO31884.1 tetratricopeptide repeat protein [Mesorhizobium sp. M1B.F.Ca.ET.045.04.1.1]
MRLHVVFLPVAVMLALSGCQTTKTGSVNAKDQVLASQSDRLIKLADDIDARGENDTAIALYQRAAAMPDAKPSALVKAGDAYMRAGYPTDAAKAYQAALAKAPNDGEAMLGLGSAMIEAGDVEAGMRALAQAAPLVNSSAAYNRLGVAQTFAGRTADAQATFAQALKLAPGDLDVETNMALAAALEDNSATALPLVQKIAAAPNAQLHHKRNIVMVYGLLGQADQVKASPPIGLMTKEVATLLARARTIRSKGSTQAKAKTLGSILG